MGGAGFLAPGQQSATTVYLEPGTYIAECYVKSEGEQFHSYSEPGQPRMLSMLTVTAEPSRAKEPRATMEVSISKPDQGGMEIEEQVRPGLHTVAVHFGEQQVYRHLLGHNAQLVRLENKSDALLADLGAWMDWTQIGAFTHGSPIGTQFVGGAMEMAGGSVAYVHVNLRPGDYAWIAEVPDPAENGMLKAFTAK
jgi:hypothetical protein